MYTQLIINKKVLVKKKKRVLSFFECMMHDTQQLQRVLDKEPAYQNFDLKKSFRSRPNPFTKTITW